MRKEVGPCEGCGTLVHKHVRPGRRRYCMDCALEAMARQHRELASRTGDRYEKSIERGRTMAEQYATQEGRWYEKWREGMQRYLQTSFTTEQDQPATVTPTDQPAPRRRTRRT